MMKMLIKIDEQKVDEEGKYDLEDMWRLIDSLFTEKYHMFVERKDGTTIYTGNENYDYFSGIAIAFYRLREQEWFAHYCTEWKMLADWFNNEFAAEDLIKSEKRRKNPLFCEV